ncbi:crossover junction endonuclease MUS81, partial [Phenoliferia sp. Uapishka_3]
MPPRLKVVPGNPQWVTWIEDLAEKEEEKGSKSADSYKKAAKSLKSNPITFTHPQQAAALVGVGAKTVEHLLKKMKAQCEMNGEEMPELVVRAKAPAKAATKKRKKAGPDSDEERAADAAKEARRARTGAIPLRGPPLPAEAYGEFSQLIAKGALDLGFPPVGGRVLGGAPAARRLVSDDEEEADNASNAGVKKKKSAKEYVPKQRSGAFGVIIGLYKLSSYEEQETWVTKNELIAVAAEYSDTSYDKPAQNRTGGAVAGPQAHYTAWSGIKVLFEKNIIQKDSKRPQRFALTEETGYPLAERLLKFVDVPPHPRRGGPSSGAASGHKSGSNGGGAVAGRFSHQGARAPSYDFEDDDEPPRKSQKKAEIEEEREARELEAVIQLSLRESQPSSSGASASNAHPSQGRIPLPLPLPLPRAMPPIAKSRNSMDFLLGPTGSSLDVVGAGRPRQSGTSLDARKAASGSYARASRPAEVVPEPFGEDGPLLFSYLDEDDHRLPSRKGAEVGYDEQQRKTYRVEFPARQSHHKHARAMQPKPLEMIRSIPLPGGRTMSGFLAERHAIENPPGVPDLKGKGVAIAPVVDRTMEDGFDNFASLMGAYVEPAKKDKSAMYAPPPSVRRSAPDSEDDDDLVVEAPIRAPRPSTQPSTSSSNKERLTLPTALHAPTTSSLARTHSAPPPPRAGPSRPIARPSSSVSSLPQNSSHLTPVLTSYDRPRGSTIINRHPLDPVKDHISSTSIFPDIVPIVLLPGSFKIVLIIDTREIRGTKMNRQDIVERMTREGVAVDQKMLPLGDMIWVARRIGRDGQPTGEDDVVLDAIVERKRLDDLCISIRDGRYNGQKIRMKNSAISHRIYLIEKWNTEQTCPYFPALQQSSRFGGLSCYLSLLSDKEWGAQIWTAKSQLQINDGFYVHISANVLDTIGYLKLRTQVMIELYENTTLYVIPDAHIDRPTYLGLQQHLRLEQPHRQYLTTYNSFENLNKTDAALTLRQHWAAMIQCVSGISAEKAGPFIERWPTPILFFEEAMCHQAIVEAENRELDRTEDPAKKGKGPKRRKCEDFVVEALGDGGQRAIKGALSAKLWTFAMAKGKYPNKSKE